MYITFLLTPKPMVTFLYNSDSIEYSLEKLKQCGFKEIPVIEKDGHFCGVVSEGDFLWALLDGKVNHKNKVSSICRNTNQPIKISSTPDEITERLIDYNFVPVVDDRDYFCGIVTRKSIMQYLIKMSDQTIKERMIENESN